MIKKKLIVATLKKHNKSYLSTQQNEMNRALGHLCAHLG